MIASSAAARLRELAHERILLTDGAWGTMIQTAGLDEAGYRGNLDLGHDQKGNNDLLCLTQPALIEGITRAYLEAGSDIVSTNTFNANAVSMADYGAVHLVREINLAAAGIARRAADAAATADKPRFVAGSIGPTNKTLSLSPDVNDPGFRAIDFDELKAVYAAQAGDLLDGGVDFILVETIFDTLNAKAAIVAVNELAEARGAEIPLMLSMTITDMSGRNLSGHSVEAFAYAVSHARPLTIGLNCAFGADLMRPHVQALAGVTDALLMAYPNAGLPNELGAYDEAPDQTGHLVGGWIEEGIVNIVGGCCGTTPAHIAAMARAAEGRAPRRPRPLAPVMRLAGLDPFVMAA